MGKDKENINISLVNGTQASSLYNTSTMRHLHILNSAVKDPLLVIHFQKISQNVFFPSWRVFSFNNSSKHETPQYVSCQSLCSNCKVFFEHKQCVMGHLWVMSDRRKLTLMMLNTVLNVFCGHTHFLWMWFTWWETDFRTPPGSALISLISDHTSPCACAFGSA